MLVQTMKMAGIEDRGVNKCTESTGHATWNRKALELRFAILLDKEAKQLQGLVVVVPTNPPPKPSVQVMVPYSKLSAHWVVSAAGRLG